MGTNHTKAWRANRESVLPDYRCGSNHHGTAIESSKHYPSPLGELNSVCWIALKEEVYETSRLLYRFREAQCAPRERKIGEIGAGYPKNMVAVFGLKISKCHCRTLAAPLSHTGAASASVAAEVVAAEVVGCLLRWHQKAPEQSQQQRVASESTRAITAAACGIRKHQSNHSSRLSHQKAPEQSQ